MNSENNTRISENDNLKCNNIDLEQRLCLKVNQIYQQLSSGLDNQPGICLFRNEQKLKINSSTLPSELESIKGFVTEIFFDVIQIKKEENIQGFAEMMRFLKVFSNTATKMRLIFWDNFLDLKKHGHLLNDLIINSPLLTDLNLDLGSTQLNDGGISQIFKTSQNTNEDHQYPLPFVNLNISISFNNIPGEQFGDLISFIAQCPQLKSLKLDLMSNNLSKHTVALLISQLKVLPHLEVLSLNIIMNPILESDARHISFIGGELSALQNITHLYLHFYSFNEEIEDTLALLREETILFQQLRSCQYLRLLDVKNFNLAELNQNHKQLVREIASNLMNIDGLLQYRLEIGFEWFLELDVLDHYLLEKESKLSSIAAFQRHIQCFQHINPNHILIDLYFH